MGHCQARRRLVPFVLLEVVVVVVVLVAALGACLMVEAELVRLVEVMVVVLVLLLELH